MSKEVRCDRCGRATPPSNEEALELQMKYTKLDGEKPSSPRVTFDVCPVCRQVIAPYLQRMVRALLVVEESALSLAKVNDEAIFQLMSVVPEPATKKQLNSSLVRDYNFLSDHDLQEHLAAIEYVAAMRKKLGPSATDDAVLKK